MGTAYRTTTNADGEFTLANALPGKYTLTVSASGYQSEAVSVEVVSGKTTTVPDIVMYPTPTKSGSASLLPNQCFDLGNGVIMSCSDDRADFGYFLSVDFETYILSRVISPKGYVTTGLATKTEIAIPTCYDVSKSQKSINNPAVGQIICGVDLRFGHRTTAMRNYVNLAVPTMPLLVADKRGAAETKIIASFASVEPCWRKSKSTHGQDQPWYLNGQCGNQWKRSPVPRGRLGYENQEGMPCSDSSGFPESC